MDRISDLPDCLLHHILSFLPTITAISTALLSRRWRHLCHDLQVIDFSQDAIHWDRFSALVTAFLERRRRHRATPTRFRLSCRAPNDGYTIPTWVHPMIGPNLQELHLSLNPKPNTYGFQEFPLTKFFNCNSLVSLTLKGNIRLDNLIEVHLPSLKTLELDATYVEPVNKLLAGSPVLETLKILTRSPVLETLKILIRLRWRVRNSGNAVTGDLEIDKPSLKYLHISAFESPIGSRLRLSVSDFPNILEAQLDITPNQVNVAWLPKLLRALHKTRLLVLEQRTIDCLVCAPGLYFADFNYLRRLILWFPHFNSRFLLDLLHNCHVLRVLEIHNQKRTSQICFVPQSCGWTQPTSAPNCVISHLNVVEFEQYEDSAEERAFTEYILRRGLVLETMTIRTRDFPHHNKAYICEKASKELSIVPRGSDICQLKIT